jgi:hypothetical protein
VSITGVSILLDVKITLHFLWTGLHCPTYLARISSNMINCRRVDGLMQAASAAFELKPQQK